MRPYHFDFERHLRPGEPSCGWRELRKLLDGALAPTRLWRRRLRDRHELARLDARMLRDIGVTPTEAAREAGKPFWRG